MPSSESLAERARRAREKKATLGPDIDLSKYSSQTKEHPPTELASLSKREQELLALAGIDVTGKSRSGTFVQMDHSVK